MINKIMEHRSRNGALAFLLGLFVVVGSLYIDAFRGDASGTIGLYQIVGALAGYIVSAVGVVLIAKETGVRKAVQNIMFYGGGIIILVSMFTDYIGIPGTPAGFDRFQMLGTAVGVVIVVLGFFVLPTRFFE